MLYIQIDTILSKKEDLNCNLYDDDYLLLESILKKINKSEIVDDYFNKINVNNCKKLGLYEKLVLKPIVENCNIDSIKLFNLLENLTLKILKKDEESNNVLGIAISILKNNKFNISIAWLEKVFSEISWKILTKNNVKEYSLIEKKWFRKVFSEISWDLFGKNDIEKKWFTKIFKEKLIEILTYSNIDKYSSDQKMWLIKVFSEINHRIVDEKYLKKYSSDEITNLKRISNEILNWESYLNIFIANEDEVLLVNAIIEERLDKHLEECNLFSDEDIIPIIGNLFSKEKNNRMLYIYDSIINKKPTKSEDRLKKLYPHVWNTNNASNNDSENNSEFSFKKDPKQLEKN